MAGVLLRNRHLLVVAILVLVVGGVAALFGLPRLEDPRLGNRNPFVVTFMPGADPEQVEAQVTDPIEREVREVDNIKRLESVTSLGVSFLAIELADRVVDPEPVLADLRSALDRVEPDLPSAATRPWLDDKRGAVAYGMILALRWRADAAPELGILSRYADELADRIRNVAGTELVRLHGDVDERISVAVDVAELASRGMSPDALARALASADTRLPAGSLRHGDTDQLLAVAGDFESMARIRAVPLVTAAGRVGRVADVATVARDYRDPPVAVADYAGERCVFIGAQMQADRIASAWAAEVRQVVAELEQELQGNARIDIAFDQTRYTSARLLELGSNLGLGALLIWLVTALIMGWRVGTLIAAALPLAATAIMIGFQLLGLPLHQMSIFGLLVAMGLLIDNAIVVCDDVWKLRRSGMAASAAVVVATRHLAVPLFASSLTTALSFAPILLLQGNVGEFVGTIASAVILAIAVSFLLSLSIIAALAGLLPLPRERERAPRSSARWLQSVAAFVRRQAKPSRLVLLTLLPPVLAFGLVSTLENQFFPAADRNQFQVEVYANGSQSLDGTHSIVQRIDEHLRSDPDVEATMWVTGQSLPSVYYNQIMETDDAPAYAEGVVVTRDAATAKQLLRRCERDLLDLAPEAQVVVRPFAQGPPVTAPVMLRVYGDDLDRLVAIGDEVRDAMIAAPGVLHTRASIPTGLPQGEIVFDEEALREVGLTAGAAAAQVRAALEGASGGEVLEGTRRLPVVVRQPVDARRSGAQLLGLDVVSPTGETMPLGAVAALQTTPRVVRITRRNGERVNSLFGFVDSDTLPIEAVHDVVNRLDARDVRMPDGYRLELGGDAEESDQAAAQLVRYIPLLGTIIAATLVLSFRSALLALLLAAVGGLSAGYGLFALWLSGFPLGFNPLIGLAGLIGITFNDSIVVLAAIRADRDASSGDDDAITRVVRGCRRHVWATTLTTAVGFLPLLLFSGGDFWPPLAVVIAGGVLGATPLALVFVPVAYRWLLRLRPSLGRASAETLAVTA